MKSQQISVLSLVLLMTAATAPSGAAAPFKWPTAQTDNQKPTPAPAEPVSAPAAATPQTTPTDAAPAEPATPQPVDKASHIDAIKHYNKGVDLHQSGFYNQAIEEYSQAIAADPTMEQAWSNLGAIYTAQKSFNKAADAFDKALKLKPDRPATLNGLATVLFARGKVEEAMEKWKQALQIDPKFASAYFNIGFALESEKKPYDAVGQYVRAISINPRMADPYYRIGAIYLKERHPAQAKLMLNKSIELAPSGDFSKDAKKQLQAINSEFASEGDVQEVQMNVVPPAGDHQAPAPAAQATAATTTPPQGDSDGTEPKKGLFGHKQKHKKVEMIVSPPADDTDSASAHRDDLQEKPAN